MENRTIYSPTLFGKLFGNGSNSFKYECRIAGVSYNSVYTISHNGNKNITFNMKDGSKLTILNK